MRGFRFFGEVFFEYMIVSLMLILSFVLVIPFIPMFIGLVGYFSHDRDFRIYKDIFKTIKENFKIIIKFTILEGLLFIFSVLNLYYFVQHYQPAYGFIIVASAVALIVAIVLLVNAPIIIVNMEVNLRGLLRNSIMLIFGGLIPAVACILIVAFIMAVCIYYPPLTPFLLFFMPLVDANFMKKNFLVLKAQALKVNVSDLEKKQKDDGYLDEYGQVDHSTDDQK